VAQHDRRNPLPSVSVEQLLPHDGFAEPAVVALIARIH
jgi:hypothetical protein